MDYKKVALKHVKKIRQLEDEVIPKLQSDIFNLRQIIEDGKLREAGELEQPSQKPMVFSCSVSRVNEKREADRQSAALHMIKSLHTHPSSVRRLTAKEERALINPIMLEYGIAATPFLALIDKVQDACGIPKEGET